MKHSLWLAAVCAVLTAPVHAASVRVSFGGNISSFNPGPLTANAAFSGSFILDDSVVPSGNNFNEAIDGFVFNSGGLSFRGENGRLQILQTTNTDFLSGNFDIGNASVEGSVPDGVDSYTLSNVSFDFRLPGTAIDTGLPVGFELADFSFVSLVLDFTHPAANSIDRTTILRGGSFDTLSFTPVPLPAAGWLLGSATGALAWRIRRRV